MLSSKQRTTIKIAITLAILAFLIWKVNPAEIGSRLSGVTPMLILLMAIHYSLSFLFNSTNLYIFLRATGEKIKFSKFLPLNWYAYSIGQFFPGRIGEVSITKILQNAEDISPGKTLSLFVLDKGITLVVLALVAAIGIWLVFPELLFWIVVIGLLLVVLLGTFLFLSRQGVRRWIQSKLKGKYGTFFHGFAKGFVLIFKEGKWSLATNLGISLGRALLASVLITLMFKEYSMEIPILLIFVVNAISMLTSLIPISVSGIGLKESAAVFLLSSLGYDAATLATVYLLLTLFHLLMSTGYFVIYFNRKGKPDKSPTEVN